MFLVAKVSDILRGKDNSGFSWLNIKKQIMCKEGLRSHNLQSTKKSFE